MVQSLVGQLLLPRELSATWFLRRHENFHLGKREREKAQVLQQPTPRWQGIRRGVSDGLIVRATAVGVTEKENREGRIDQQDIFHGVVFFLAAITIGLFSRVLGAHDASLGAVMGKRGETSPGTSGEEMGAAGGATPPATPPGSRRQPAGPLAVGPEPTQSE